MNIFEQLLHNIGGFIEAYRSDLLIDEKCFVNNTPFIHIARKTGSRMVTKYELLEVATKVIEEPHGTTRVLFSNVQNSDLLRIAYDNAMHTLSYDTRQKTDILIHYYDGSTLIKIDDIAVLEPIVLLWRNQAQSKINDGIYHGV